MTDGPAVPPRSVSTLWIGSPMTQYERLCIASFVAAGFDVDVHTFDPELQVPDGARRQDAREVLPESSVFENQAQPGTYAAYSNIFRYRLLQMQDTTWVDADVLLVSDGLPADPYLFGLQRPERINNAVLRAPRDSELLVELYRGATAVQPRDVVWGQLGPRLLTETAVRLGLTSLAQPVHVLYPVWVSDAWTLFDPAHRDRLAEQLADASALHLWNEVLRRAGGGLKTRRPPRGSLLADLMGTYGIAADSDEDVDLAWVRGTWRRTFAAHQSLGTRLRRTPARLARRLRR
jgi:hypothetical protein